MRAEELRIGNYFEYGKSNAIDQVYTIEFDRLEGRLINKIPEDHCRPISLTEEWLLKAGSEHPDKNDHYGGLLIPIGDSDYKLRIRQHDGYYSWYLQGYEVDCRYVSQLQNLYFALTGQELQFN